MHIPDGFIPWTQCAIYYIILIKFKPVIDYVHALKFFNYCQSQ